MSEMVEKKSKVKIDTSAISDILRKTNEELETASNEYLEMVKAEQLKKEETVEALNVTLENLKIKQETLNERLERLEGEEKEVIGKHKAIEKDIESKQSQIQSWYNKYKVFGKSSLTKIYDDTLITNFQG